MTEQETDEEQDDTLARISEHTAPASQITQVEVEDEMEQSYIDYAMSVIIGRSLPDARDGFKPVQRRILYTMHEEGITSRKSHRKSSSIVGETMGNYHPHGDTAIYDSLVRMAQPFKLRLPLVDGQGNFGSIDGDEPAAMRYTEARLDAAGEMLLEDLDMDTVDFQSNYDDRLEEPEVLPARYPNLLVNGASGIAVGMGTEIPPHNLGEIIDATIHLIDNQDCSIDDLIEYVPGPDLPTGGTIIGRDGIHDAYKTGKGKIRIRANYKIEEQDNGAGRIVVTEIPFKEKKSRMVEKIARKVDEGKIEGISDIRDESDRDGIRIVIELKRDAVTRVVENALIDSVFERTIGIQLLALVDDQPTMLTLRDALEVFYEHRVTIIERRSEYELAEKEAREHILEGRIRAIQNAEEIVETIREEENRDAATQALKDEFDFSEEQATHITRMQLGSLTSLEVDEVKEEYEEVKNRIERLKTILQNKDELNEVIKKELREVKADHNTERQTNIIEDTGDVTREDLIPEEDIVVMITEEGYIKRMDLEDFSAQSRGGKGVIGTKLKKGDAVKAVYVANTHQKLLFLSSTGQVYQKKGYELPEYSRTARGTPAITTFGLDDDEEITYVIPLDDEEFIEDKTLAMVTEDGLVKRTPMDEFDNIYQSGIKAIELTEEDQICDAFVVNGETELMVATSDGRAIRFDVDDVRPTGRSSQGVNTIRLDDDQEVTGALATDGTGQMLTLTENGFGKRTEISEYRVQSRYGKGILDINTGDRNGETVTIEHVTGDEDLVVMTTEGKIVRIPTDEVSTFGRNTKGVKVVSLDEGDTVAEATLFKPSEDEETEE